MKAKTILYLFLVLLIGCIEEPVKEDVPELITKVELSFLPADGGNAVEGIATDPDGEGVQSLVTDKAIILSAGKSYLLTISLFNELADLSSPEYNVTDELEEEGEEHIILFSWTDGIFFSPSGDGNIDKRADGMNYNDQDVNGLPIGLSTSWTTSISISGKFRIVLKHQPNLKSPSSGVDIGETDLDVTFDIEVQ